MKTREVTISAGAALLAAASFNIAPARGAPGDAAALFDPQTFAAARCSGASSGMMRAYSAIGMATLRALVGGTAKQKIDEPLWPGLGTLTYKISTKNKLAQSYFDQGLRLTYAFNHGEAILSFRQAQRLDPKCAMCVWGEAYAYGSNINLPMEKEAIAPAWMALKKAMTLAPNSSKKEQALIAALTKRYAEHPPEDRSELDRAYAGAMANVAKDYVGDADIQTLYAEALMDVRPWDYWQAGGTKPFPEEEALVPTLEHAVALVPNHVGALHLYIHALEATPNVKQAEAAADRLESLMPAAGHIVHMPAHIYMRIGRQRDSINVDLAAIKADEAFMQSRKDAGFYAAAYYPHNVHFVLVSAQLGGDTDTMRAMAKKLEPLIPQELLAPVPIAQTVKAAPMLTLAHIGDYESVMAQAQPSAETPYLQHMWHFARGLVMARGKNTKGAEAELKAMRAVATNKALDNYPPGQLPARTLTGIADEILSARIAQDRGRMNEAITHLTKASQLQSSLAYTEPPFFYYPVRQSLGGLLLASGKAKEASDIFRASLLDQPGNAYALYGLMKSYEKMGDTAAAVETKSQFERAWLGKTQNIDLAWM